MASKSELGEIREAAANGRPFDTLYYSVATHRGGLALPPYVEKVLAAL